MPPIKLPGSTSNYAVEQRAAALANGALAEGVAQADFEIAYYASYDAAHKAAYALQVAYGRMRSKYRKAALAMQREENRALPESQRHLAELDARTPYDTLHSEIVDLPGENGAVVGCALRIRSYTNAEFGIRTPSTGLKIAGRTA